MPNPGRKTRQRHAILAAAIDLPGHPTAEAIHSHVRISMPHVSLGTVYRNLEIFVREGLLRRIPVYGGQACFDGNSQPHWHIHCMRCGSLKDVHDPPVPRDILRDARVGGYVVLDVECRWLGLCSRCRRAGELRDGADQRG